MPSIIKPVKFNQDNPVDAVPLLSEEEKDAIRKKQEALDKVLADDGKAKYKIELFFGRARSMHKPTPGALSFWESGAKFHGGGDTKLYLCPGKSLKLSECEAFIPDAANGYGHLVCPACGNVWKGEQVHGEILANLTMRGWSEAILKYYAKLEHNCDVYVKHARDDVRSVANREQERQRGGELLAKVRENRAVYIYPLRNIVVDTSAGADLLGRFYALLTA